MRIIYNLDLARKIFGIIKKRKYELLKLYIESGIEITAFGSGLLECAIKDNDFELAQILIDEGINLKLYDNVIKKGTPEMVEFFKAAELKMEDSEVVKNKNTETFDFIKDYKAKGLGLLSDACEKEDEEKVEKLIAAGVDVNEIFNRPLRIISDNGNFKIAKLLIDSGADTSDDTVLRILLRNKNQKILKYILEKDETRIVDIVIVTSLRDTRKLIGGFKQLLKTGVNLSTCNNQALKAALIYQKYEVLKAMVDNGIDITTFDNLAIRMAKATNNKRLKRLFSKTK